MIAVQVNFSSPNGRASECAQLLHVSFSLVWLGAREGEVRQLNWLDEKWRRDLAAAGARNSPAKSSCGGGGAELRVARGEHIYMLLAAAALCDMTIYCIDWAAPSAGLQ